MKKRLIALFFAFCMIFNLSFSAFAADDGVIKILVEERVETNDTNGYVTNTNPDTSEKDKIIPFNNRDYYIFEVTVPKTGLYTVGMRCGVHNTYPLKVQVSILNGSDYDVLLETQLIGTSGYTRVSDQDIGTVNLTEGTHKIKFLNTYSDAYLASVSFTLVEAPEISEVKANGVTVSDNVVFRGTDVLEVSLDRAVKTETVSNDTVYLIGSEKVNATVSAQGKKITLNLKETLDYDSAYKLVIDGVESGDFTLDLEYDFATTKESQSDSGSATLSDVTASNTDGVINAEGVIKGSHGFAIAGRKAHLYITAPDAAESNTICATATTDENGAFSLEYALADSAASGAYKVSVGGEYISKANRYNSIVNFVSSDVEDDDGESAVEPIKVLVEERIETNDTNSYVTNTNPDTSEKDKIIPFNNKDYYVFQINVPETGLYTVNMRCGVHNTYPLKTQLSVFNGTEYEVLLETQLKGTGGYTRIANQDIGVVSLTEGTHKIKILNTWSDAYLAYITFTLIPSLNVSEIKVNSEEMSDGDTISRGADNFEITLNQEFDINTVSNDTVYLFDGVKKVNSVLSVSGNTISLKLKETLDYEKDYTLYVDGIISENSTLKKTFTFTTSSFSSDAGKASLSQPDFSITAGVISVSGVMYGSEGLTIAGREVELYVTDPNGNGGNSVLATALTDENGEYTLEYELSNDALSGTYTITVGGEYIINADRKSGKALFVSPEAEKDFLGNFESAESGADVKECIESYAEILGIDLESDLDGLNDTDKIFDNLADYSFTSAGEFTEVYYAETLTAKINESKSEDDIEDLFADDKNIEYLDVDTLKYDALDESYSDFVESILALDNIQNSVEMKDALSKLLDSALAVEFGLTSPAFNITDFELYAGETLSIPLDLVEAKNNVKSYTLEIVSDAIKNNNVTIDAQEGVVLSVIGNTATISFNSETSISSLASLGSVKITNLSEGTHDFVILGELMQNSNGFDIAVEFDNCDFVATAHSKKPGFVYDSAMSSVTELLLKDRTNQSFNESIQTLNGVDFVGFHASSHDWVEFPITIKESGEYRIVIFAGIGTASYSPKVAVSLAAGDSGIYNDIASGALSYTGNWTTFKDHYIGTSTFEAGNYKLKVNASYADVFLAGVKLISATNIGVRDIKIGTDSLLKSDKVKRGSDVIEILFSSELYNGTITSETLQITDGKKNLAAEVSQDGDKALIILNETLNYNSDYSIYINDVSDVYNASIISNASFGFKTYGEDTDAGKAELADIKGNMLYEDAKISGCLLGSAGQKMAGREVKLYLKDANGSLTDTLKTAVTDSNGEFEINYSLPVDSVAGAYTFAIGSDYVAAEDRAECVLTYITKELGEIFLGELSNTNDISDVEELFEENETMLMIDVSEDLSELNDKDEFYKYFVNIDLDDMNSFFTLYKNAILAERFNQAENSSEIESILSNDENLELLGIEKSRFELLVNNREKFITSVYNLDAVNDVDDLFAEINAIFESNLADEYKKSDSELTAKNTDIYTGYSAVVDLAFTEPVVNAELIELVIEASDEDLLENVNFNEVGNGTLNTEYISDDTLKITFKPARPNRELSEIATLSLAPVDEGEYTLTISGNILYSISSSSELVLTNVVDKTIYIDVNKKPSGNGHSGGGTTREPSGIVRLPENDEPSIDVPVTPPEVSTTDEPFDDLANVEWAKDSVLRLHELGIISDSENKKFNPNNNVKKEELVKMIVLALELELQGESALNDVDKNAWYYQYVATAQHYGLVLGDDEGNFGIGTNLTRQDLCVIIARAVSNGDLSTADSAKFADDDAIAEYAKESVYWLKSKGMVDGVGDNKFAPNEPVTRAMAAKLIDSLLSFADKEVK